jgi:hypothetical protein
MFQSIEIIILTEIHFGNLKRSNFKTPNLKNNLQQTALIFFYSSDLFQIIIISLNLKHMKMKSKLERETLLLAITLSGEVAAQTKDASDPYIANNVGGLKLLN